VTLNGSVFFDDRKICTLCIFLLRTLCISLYYYHFLLITTYLKLLSLKSYNNCSYKKLILSRVKSLRMETRRNRNTNKRLVEYNRKTYSQRKVEVVEDAMVVVVVDVVDVVVEL